MSDRTGGLDDLFTFREEVVAEEVEVEEKPRSVAGWMIRNGLLVAVATLVTVAGLRLAGTRVSILIIVFAFIALRLLMLAVAEVAPPTMPKRGSQQHGEEPGAYRWTGTDSLRASVRRWENRLERSGADADHFSRNVLPVLGELTDERLRLKHGFTRASDPRRARELLGEPMWQILGDTERRRAPKARELEMFVEELERL